MSFNVIRLSVLSAILATVFSASAGYAASNAFEITELPAVGIHGIELAEKCGSGACGSKTSATTKDADHKCGSTKDAEHKCGSKKDAKHQCGSKKAAKAKAKAVHKKEAGHKCGSGACGSKAPKASQ